MNNTPITLPDSWPDCSPAQLAYLALNGSYGQQLCAKLLLEAIAKDLTPVLQAFPEGRWT